MTAFQHVGLSLDPTTNDLHFEGNNLVFAYDAEAVGQHVRQRLMTFQGEWFLDTSAGVPWLAQIMGKEYDPALAEAVVKAEVLDTHAVVEITSFSVGFNRALRNLEIKEVEVLTTYDEEVQV